MTEADVVIIGAGPAGLAAAVSARRAGARVAILESSDQSGGQYWRHLPADRPVGDEPRLHHQWQRYQRLRSAIDADPAVTVELATHVWAIERHDDDAVCVHTVCGEVDGAGRRRRSITAGALILATGAYDRALPVPGWTLPGVMTAGAAQALAKGERITVGERVLIAGAGPFLFPVAEAVHLTGAQVVGVYEASRPGRLGRHWLGRPWELLSAPGKLAEFTGYVGTHLRGRIPYHPGWGVVAINGTDRVTSATVARLDDQWRPVGTRRTVECDAVCLGHGFTPRLELAVAAGCDMNADRFVIVDGSQRTSVPSVFAAGEITGIGGVDLALAEGEIAGWVAAGGAPTDGAVTIARRARAASTRFAGRIANAHRIGSAWTDWVDQSTVICRCEEVDYATLLRVRDATESVGLRSLKLTTRAGLGLCQGRVCGRSVEHILAGANPRGGFADGASSDRRPIAAPIRLGELARPADFVDDPSSPSEQKRKPV